MLCERCKKQEATIHYKENINGKRNSYALCAECAAELGAFDSTKKLINDPFENMNSLFGTLFGISPYKEIMGTEEKRCDLCGATFRELAAEGKAGCPRCYSIFSDELAPTIAKIHGRTVHTGSAPAEFKAEHEKEKLIKSVANELRDAVAAEEYEKAATLRDRLRELRGEEGGKR